MKLRKPRAILRVVSMTPLIASVGPLEAPKVSKYARIAVFHCLSVRPSRETSGIGQDGNEAITSLTSSLPRSGLAW